MPDPEKIIVSWSGGKDCAFALNGLKNNPLYEIAGLLTTLDNDSQSISMHAIRRDLLEAQTSSMDYPLDIILLPTHPSNSIYIQRMKEALEKYKMQGVTYIVFADIFLEDIKEFRLKLAEESGMKALFPLWKKNTSQIAAQFIDAGFKAILTCVDTTRLDKRFAGREFNHSLLKNLPAGIDPCGEYGEFHTFVYEGPVFKRPLKVRKTGYKTKDSRFYCCNLLMDNI